MIKRLAALAFGVVAVGCGVVAVRTISFVPHNNANNDAIRLAKAPVIDPIKAATHLADAIRFQTVSHQDPAQNRWAEWDKLHAWLAFTYPTAHRIMKREVVGGKSLVYEWKGSDPSLPAIIMMAHQDVVPVTPGTDDDWKYRPFAGQIAQGSVWGRGAVDDKGSLVALFEAFETLANQGFTSKRTVYLVSGHDEEVGGMGAAQIAKQLEARGVKASFTLDEGSAIIVDEPITRGPVALIGIAEKGYATLKVTATSPGGHSSMPPPETSVINLAKAVIAINENSFPLELRGPGKTMIETLAAEQGGLIKVAAANQWLFGSLIKAQAAVSPAGAAMLHTTIAPTMLDGSPKENVLAQSASALINYRIAPWNQSRDIMARATAAVRHLPVKLSWVKPPREPSKVSSTNSQGWKLLRAAAQASAPSVTVAEYLVVAGTDSRNFQSISQDVYRFMPLRLRLKDTTMIHGTNEHMPVDDFGRIISFYAQLIATSAG